MWLVHTNLRWLVLTSRGTEKIVLGACGSVLRIICISFPFVTNNDFNQHKCVCKNGSDSRSTANNKRLGVVAAWRSFQELNFCSVFDQTVVGRRHKRYTEATTPPKVSCRTVMQSWITTNIAGYTELNSPDGNILQIQFFAIHIVFVVWAFKVVI